MKHFYESKFILLLPIWLIVCFWLKLGLTVALLGIVFWLILLRYTVPSAFFTYAAIFCSPKNREKAINRLRQATSYQPNTAYPYFTLGMMCAQKKLWDEAINNLKKAVELAKLKHAPQYQLILGEAQRESGNPEAALNTFRNLELCNQTSFKLLLDISITHLRMGNYSDALSYAENARKSNPQDLQAVLLIGQSHFGLGEYQAAKDDYLWVMERLQYPIESYYWLGRCEAGLGNIESAREYLQKAVEVIGNDPLLSDISVEEAQTQLDNLKNQN